MPGKLESAVGDAKAAGLNSLAPRDALRAGVVCERQQDAPARGRVEAKCWPHPWGVGEVGLVRSSAQSSGIQK